MWRYMLHFLSRTREPTVSSIPFTSMLSAFSNSGHSHGYLAVEHLSVQV